jgi:hypothetical protein
MSLARHAIVPRLRDEGGSLLNQRLLFWHRDQKSESFTEGNEANEEQICGHNNFAIFVAFC